MGNLRKIIIFFFLTILLIELIECVPAVNEEESIIIAVNSCEHEELLTCTNDDDDECEKINNERNLKRQKICETSPQCTFCNFDTQPEISALNETDLFIEPEIVPTLSPLSEMSAEKNKPINEIITIDADISTVTENQSINRNDKEPAKLIERNIVIANDNETHYYRGYVDPSSNITTIIRLTNLINNTNVINMPTTLNNTNINNIHIYSNKTSNNGGKFGLGYTEEGACCWTTKPGTRCKKTTVGPKCEHKKVKVCGKQCTKKMIHQKNPCNNIPQWPYIICPQQMNSGLPQYYPQFSPPTYPQFDDEFDDDDDLPLFPEDEELLKAESGWVVMQEKCKIVSEDGLHISNCTENNIEFEHPYARNSIGDQQKRSARHAGKFPQNMPTQNSFMPPQFYGYPIMQPLYFQPIPIYIPQYYPPQPLLNNYPQQIPFPPLDSDQYYEEPIIQQKAINPYKKSRKHARKHPIVVEHDEEL
ncbi:unnamed protein product [Chironomus riparius]|uniref:Uncharacterized protein n=1 Tax=Chironomus riparius TaxID=315576 RepID=A0A9N9RXF5_9DIPT|nr:unnamed protein product [Chironomus riparius]